VVDLDLDLDTPGPVSVPPMTAPEITQPFSAPSAPAPQSAAADLNFELPPIAPVASPPAQPAPMDFDLDGLSLDLDAPATASRAAPAAAPGRPSGFGDLELPDVSAAQPAMETAASDAGGADPLARKLELAEEFRQIGDTEGARDLLEEVIAKAQGALRLRAESMLGDLT
jgi:pilus assembly protein FimV